MTARIIDISSWQHPNGAKIDFERVKAAGIVGVIVKSTQGRTPGVGVAASRTYKNPYFEADVYEARAAGLLIGAYHFATPAQNEATDEAAWALQGIAGLQLELGLSLDFEELGSKQAYEVAPWAEAWLAAVSVEVPLVPFYTTRSLLSSVTGAPFGYPLWIADPDGSFEGPPAPWMQQTGQGIVDGIEGLVDLDTLFGARGINPEPITPAQPPATIPAPVTHPPTEVDVNLPELSVSSPGPNVVEGAVKTVQAVLAGKFGIVSGVTGCDGRFGPATEQAVRTFQQRYPANCGADDGIVGPLTWGALVDL